MNARVQGDLSFHIWTSRGKPKEDPERTLKNEQYDKTRKNLIRSVRWYSHPSIKRIRWFKNRVIVKTITIIKPSNEELQLKKWIT